MAVTSCLWRQVAAIHYREFYNSWHWCATMHADCNGPQSIVRRHLFHLRRRIAWSVFVGQNHNMNLLYTCHRYK